MIILSHRGAWTRIEEKNTLSALARSRQLGFGTETDIRDDRGRLVVSHDPPGGAEAGIDDLLALFADSGLWLALNVKSDGIGPLMAESCRRHCFTRWFAFDMSVPQMIQYRRAGLPFFSRHSDWEPRPSCYDDCAGIWLDAFDGEWYGADVVRRHLAAGKRVCVVSPELHGRAHAPLWAMLGESGLDRDDRVKLCTDHPVEARAAFGETQ